MKFFKSILKESHETRKTFNYSKGNVSLSFTLKMDKMSELENFKELLLKAVSDIEQELEK